MKWKMLLFLAHCAMRHCAKSILHCAIVLCAKHIVLCCRTKNKNKYLSHLPYDIVILIPLLIPQNSPIPILVNFRNFILCSPSSCVMGLCNLRSGIFCPVVLGRTF